ncbi:MAG: SUMF1/EgtB/PvdO family nonheme iron enzyme, partial [Planctomycetaceae bacterium]|nr:SUMF1/EgtB/PvdO family nonheme iron enzyme [Planctomycetaceae bacterium]
MKKTADWFYYDEKGNKSSVSFNLAALNELALYRLITPHTIVEAKDGKRCRAEDVRGLSFPQDPSLAAPPAAVRPRKRRRKNQSAGYVEGVMRIAMIFAGSLLGIVIAAGVLPTLVGIGLGGCVGFWVGGRAKLFLAYCFLDNESEKWAMAGTIAVVFFVCIAAIWFLLSGGEKGGIAPVAFPQLAVTASADNTARIWEPAAGKELWKLEGHTDTVHSAAFSLDDKLLVTASADKTARIWDTATGKELRKLEGHTGEVLSAAFSPDGRWAATASADKTARLWDTATGKELRKLEGHTDTVRSAAFSPDGKLLVTAGTDEIARLWDTASGKELRKLEEHTGEVCSAAFSFDGKLLATASFDRTARIWDTATGKELRKIRGHTGKVLSAAFSPDGKLLVTAGADKSVRLWETATGKELRKLKGDTGQVLSAAFSPDGKLLITASADKTARLWDTATGKQLQKLEGHTGEVLSSSFSPDSKLAAVAAVPAPEPKPEPPPKVERQDADSKAGSLLELTIKDVKFRFRWCPAGTFTMGSPSSEKDRRDVEVQHRVTLSQGFWMGETEVTQKQWESIMGENPSYFKGAKLPVEQVSWNDCQDFVKKLNALG